MIWRALQKGFNVHAYAQGFRALVSRLSGISQIESTQEQLLAAPGVKVPTSESGAAKAQGRLLEAVKRDAPYAARRGIALRARGEAQTQFVLWRIARTGATLKGGGL